MIEEMTVNDLPEILKIENESFAEHWSEKDFVYELNENPYARLFVLRDEGKVVAYCDIWVIFERLELASIAVAEEHRHRGFGRRLMEFVDEIGRQKGCEFAFLEVRESNLAARALYEKCGYMQLRIKRDYYQDNHEDAVEYMKGLV